MSPRRRLRGEEGASLAVAITSLALMISLGAVALQQAVNALSATNHQTSVKRALQAADSGLSTAAFRLERADLSSVLNIDPLNPTSVITQNCVISRGDVLGGIDLAPLDMVAAPDPGGRRWCPETAAEPATAAKPADGGPTFSYRVSQLLRVGSGTCGQDDMLSLDREVVVVGRDRDATRRVRAKLRASIALLSGAGVQSASATSPLTMAGTARVLGSVQGNGSISGVATNVIAGNATAGPTGTVTGVMPTGGTGNACQPFVLPLVDQGDAHTNNDNASRTDGCVDLTGLIGISCRPLLVTTGGVHYDAGRRTLRVWGNGRAILTGSTYSFCSIRLEGQAMLQVRNNPLVRIFLDDPDNCRDGSGNLISNAGQITMDGQARIVNCHLQTEPHTLQLYAVGNASIGTTQTLAGGSLITGAGRSVLCGANVPLEGEPVTVYAPRSTIELGGSTAIAGQVAGHVVHMSGASAVQPVNSLINLNQLGSNPVLPLYQPAEYVECTGRDFSELPAANPAQGC